MITRTGKIYLTLSLIIILGVSAAYVWRGDIEVMKAEAHMYGKPEVSIKDIQLDVFYTAPNDKKAHDYTEIKMKLESMLPQIVAFHKSQFGDKSSIHYRVFPREVILKDAGIVYDTDDTRYGNPQALKNVTLELEARVYDSKGDLFNRDFITPPHHFRVIAIIYEGLGAAGTEGSILLSRDFITRGEYKEIGSSLFYHEFGHAIGIPEGYDIYTNRPFTNDIMGSGRRAPLKSNYIDRSTLIEMDVF